MTAAHLRLRAALFPAPRSSRYLSSRQLAGHVALAWLSALLLLALFPPFGYRFLAPLALAPLLIALARTESSLLRFLLGWSAGVVYWFGLCTWIQFVLAVHGAMGAAGGWATFLLFCVIKAIHLGVFAWLAGPLMWRLFGLPAVAALWTGLERTHGTFGFAWLTLGNAGIDMAIPLRLAPYLGVYGLSFLFCLLAAGVAVVVLRYDRRFMMPLLLLPCLLLFPAIPPRMPAPQYAIAVQPNADTETRWSADLLANFERQLAELSNALPARLVVWPELPAPLYFFEDPPFHALAQSIARRHGFFLFGTVAYNEQRSPLNSAVLLDASGGLVGRYDKIYLVPFGEFVPPFFSWVNRISAEISDFVPGREIKVFPAGANRLGTFICYESAFPHLVRRFAAGGATVLVNLSNDGYFGRSAAYAQHLLLVRMRAIENRRFVLRATNDGITAAIDPAGRLLASLKPFQQAAILLPYGAVSETTFYTRHGDWFAWLCLALGSGAAAQTQIASRIRYKRATPGSH